MGLGIWGEKSRDMGQKVQGYGEESRDMGKSPGIWGRVQGYGEKGPGIWGRLAQHKGEVFFLTPMFKGLG